MSFEVPLLEKQKTHDRITAPLLQYYVMDFVKETGVPFQVRRGGITYSFLKLDVRNLTGNWMTQGSTTPPLASRRHPISLQFKVTSDLVEIGQWVWEKSKKRFSGVNADPLLVRITLGIGASRWFVELNPHRGITPVSLCGPEFSLGDREKLSSARHWLLEVAEHGPNPVNQVQDDLQIIVDKFSDNWKRSRRAWLREQRKSGQKAQVIQEAKEDAKDELFSAKVSSKAQAREVIRILTEHLYKVEADEVTRESLREIYDATTELQSRNKRLREAYKIK